MAICARVTGKGGGGLWRWQKLLGIFRCMQET
ncbi:hypothetical protein CCACVL1_13889 [Corchorus capsularis]|uniref:Uncharacterized protein n=1 Tax=Corchorus capsularis TaxID=210143 RepID=A0A1R3I974_COCAP|nr:hypothetical protein CCACVL1_13889 [Corchorus capsularis]